MKAVYVAEATAPWSLSVAPARELELRVAELVQGEALRDVLRAVPVEARQAQHRRAVRLGVVAPGAGGHHVVPGVPSAAAARHYVVEGQSPAVLPAVHALPAVSCEEDAA